MTTRALYFSDGNRAMMLVGRSLLFRSKYASGVVSPSDTSSGNPTSVARAFTVPFFSWLRITRLSLTKDFSLLSYVPSHLLSIPAAYPGRAASKNTSTIKEIGLNDIVLSPRLNGPNIVDVLECVEDRICCWKYL